MIFALFEFRQEYTPQAWSPSIVPSFLTRFSFCSPFLLFCFVLRLLLGYAVRSKLLQVSVYDIVFVSLSSTTALLLPWLSYIRVGAYRWEYIVVGWLRHADIGNAFSFCFPIF